MTYREIKKAVFLARPNRFIAKVQLDGKEETVHVKNTGRCLELLIPGCTVYLSVSDNPTRKTKYDLVAVEKHREGNEPLLINMDSQLPNDAVAEWLPKSGLFSGNAEIRREVTFGESRFDFYVEDGDVKVFLEVKGVTLENSGVAMFPDAPTERGIKHIKELISCVQSGYSAYIVFVIQMKGVCEFRPNDGTHKAFGDALRDAHASGVKIIAVDSAVTPESMVIDRYVQVKL